MNIIQECRELCRLYCNDFEKCDDCPMKVYDRCPIARMTTSWMADNNDAMEVMMIIRRVGTNNPKVKKTLGEITAEVQKLN